MSSFDCLKSPVFAGVGDPVIVVAGVQATSAIASAAMRAEQWRMR